MDISYNKQRANLFIREETTPGTYVGSTSLFIADWSKLPFRNMKLKTSNKEVDRFIDRASLLSVDSLFYGAEAELSFDVDLYTSGAAGTDTKFNRLLLSMMSSTVTAGTSVVYTCNSSATTTYSAGVEYISEDGTASQRFAIKGARVSALKLEGTIGAQGVWSVTLKGPIAYEGSPAAPVAQIAATPVTGIEYETLNAHIPQFQGMSFSVNGVNRLISKFSLDFGPKVEAFADVSDATTIQRYVLVGIEPTLTIDPVLTPAATAADFAQFFAGATGALSIPIGTTAGEKITIAAPRQQHKTTDNGERSSFRTVETTYRLNSNSSAGDDALTVTFA